MPNRLAHEKSPYLLQHANNPVDWYPWGEEAFSKARREEKPIFLSVGYATCHWCHVMERESFENPAVAKVLNESFVSIKVDREERPDIDRIYMMFVQASTGSGGWPMSVWLTPDRKPFFGGTYFPPDNRYGRPGFTMILARLAEAWNNDRTRIEESGARVIEQLREYSDGGEPAVRRDLHDLTSSAGGEILDSAYFTFRRIFDTRLGGFGQAPKFPRPSIHNFLLRYYAAEPGKRDESLEMVLKTLQEMAKGGMHDQLGGGFHRYSVDDRWFVPHFEKMLYDQAQLASSYVEAFQITRDGLYAEIARDIFDYVLRDMTSPEGGFYSAEDADSAADPAHPHEKGEGAFYIWSWKELVDTLGEADAAAFAFRFGCGEHGNVDHDPQGEFAGRNILYQAHTVEETAARFKKSEAEVRDLLHRAATKLMSIRAERPRPLLDDKILAAWNGLMISAFAKGAQVLDEPKYAQAARRAADFLKRNMWDETSGRLVRRHRGGESAIAAFLDDYAFVALGLLDLYETTFEPGDFEWCIRLTEEACAQFEDREQGGFFSTSEEATTGDLILRLKDDHDGAEPAGNSAMTILLLRLAQMTGRDDFRLAAERTLATFASKLEEGGAGLPNMLMALLFARGLRHEIVLAGPSDDPTYTEMLRSIRRRFLPNAVLMRAEQCSADMPAIDGQPTAYVCEDFTCQLPVTDVDGVNRLLDHSRS